jgi:hypothetical protein
MNRPNRARQLWHESVGLLHRQGIDVLACLTGDVRAETPSRDCEPELSRFACCPTDLCSGVASMMH